VNLPSRRCHLSDRPKSGCVHERFGTPRFVWFSASKNAPPVSRLISRLMDVRATLTSTVSMPGGELNVCPHYGNVYAGGAANAPRLNQVVALRVPGPIRPFQPNLQVRVLSECGARFPCPNTEMVSGKPLCNCTTADILRFEVTARVKSLRPHHVPDLNTALVQALITVLAIMPKPSRDVCLRASQPSPYR
jgi:hypothetical protein